jgi:hypothetical protein
MSLAVLEAPVTRVDLLSPIDPLTDPIHTPEPTIGSPIYDQLKREWARRAEKTTRVEHRRQSRVRRYLRGRFMALIGRHLPTPAEELDAKIAKFLREVP